MTLTKKEIKCFFNFVFFKSSLSYWLDSITLSSKSYTECPPPFWTYGGAGKPVSLTDNTNPIIKFLCEGTRKQVSVRRTKGKTNPPLWELAVAIHKFMARHPLRYYIVSPVPLEYFQMVNWILRSTTRMAIHQRRTSVPIEPSLKTKFW